MVESEASITMSHKAVQLFIGQLLTDEELRYSFVRHPFATLSALRERGVELTRGEIEALAQTDRQVWETTAERIHPHLQRSSLRTENEK